MRQEIKTSIGKRQYMMNKLIQMTKADYFNTNFTSASYGVEQEMSKYKVIMQNRVEVFAIISKNEKILLLITADMGSNNKYTIELVSTPTEMSDEDGKKDRIESAKIAVSQIETASRTEKEMEPYNNEDGFQLKNIYNNYKIEDETPDVTTPLMSNQISVGVENSIEEIEKIITTDYGWYQKDKYTITSTSETDPKIQFGYNYLMCIIEKFADILKKKEDVTSPQSKNSWGIMPRTNSLTTVSNLFEQGENKIHIITQLIDTETKKLGDEYVQAWKTICDGAILGHNLKDSVINGKPSSVFEIRNPDNSWSEYFYSPYNNSPLSEKQQEYRQTDITDIIEQIKKRKVSYSSSSDESDNESSDEYEW